MLGEELLHPDGAAERALRVVLVGDRRAKDDEDRVANELFDRPVIPECFLGEVLEDPGDEHLQLLRIQVLGERGEPDEVSEQHRHQAALLVLGLDPSHVLSVAHPNASRSASADAKSLGPGVKLLRPEALEHRLQRDRGLEGGARPPGGVTCETRHDDPFEERRKVDDVV